MLLALPPSPRELQVAHLIAEGLTDKEIGVRLGITASTVNSFTIRLYRKLGVHNRASVAYWVGRHEYDDAKPPDSLYRVTS